MTSVSVSGSLWPYLLVKVFWIVACGYLFVRAWMAKPRSWRSAERGTLRLERRSPHRAQDTQAGRI